MPKCLASARLAAACLCLLALLSAHSARACSVCLPGDPVFSGAGATAQEEGSFVLYLETRGYSKTSGGLGHAEPGEEPHETDEESRGQRLDLFASWTPIDRFTVTLDVPVAWNRITHVHHDERTRSTLSGLGDVSLASSVVLWRDRPVLPSRWLEGRVWLKAPTGRDETKVDGERDPHLQPGTGSWDVGLGLAGVQRTAWGAIHGSVFRRWNQDGSLDYRQGNVWLASLGLEAPLGHLLRRPSLGQLVPRVRPRAAAARGPRGALRRRRPHRLRERRRIGGGGRALPRPPRTAHAAAARSPRKAVSTICSRPARELDLDSGGPAGDDGPL